MPHLWNEWIPGRARDDSGILIIDRDPIALPEERISGEGYLNISARIARTGIQTYYGHELTGAIGEVEPDKIYRVYRAEEEVFAVDALESFHNLPITLGHPDEEVSVSNYKDHAVGHVIGHAIRDGAYIRAEMTIRDAAAIEKIKSGEAAELSVGYHAEVHLESGVSADGQLYDAIQTQIRGNHIALVDQARCGPQCTIERRIADQANCGCASCQIKKENKMTQFVTLDGEQIDIAEAVEKLKAANAQMAQALKEAEETIQNLSADLETKSGEVEALSAKPTEDSAFTAKVQARAKILTEARQILGDSSALSTLADADIRRQVINRIYGDDFASGASDHALLGMYRVALRDSQKDTDSLNGRIRPAQSQSDLKQAQARRNARLTNAWQTGA